MKHVDNRSRAVRPQAIPAYKGVMTMGFGVRMNLNQLALASSLVSWLLLGCDRGREPVEPPSQKSHAVENGPFAEPIRNSVEGATVALLDLNAGEVSEAYRIESTQPIWIGYEVLLGLIESDVLDPANAKNTSTTEIVRIERLGHVEPGNVGSFGSSSLNAATVFIPQDNQITVEVRNLSDRRIIVRLFSKSRR